MLHQLMKDLIIITSKGKIQKARRRFTREEVLAAAKKMIQNKDPKVCYNNLNDSNNEVSFHGYKVK